MRNSIEIFNVLLFQYSVTISRYYSSVLLKLILPTYIILIVDTKIIPISLRIIEIESGFDYDFSVVIKLVLIDGGFQKNQSLYIYNKKIVYRLVLYFQKAMK